MKNELRVLELLHGDVNRSFGENTGMTEGSRCPRVSEYFYGLFGK